MDKLGIEPVQLLTQTFNFIVMVVILTKFLYKPILKVLEERKKKIAEGLAYTDKMKQELETTESKRTEVINKAKDEARKIIEEGKKSAEKLEAEIIEKGHREAQEIIAKGKKDVEMERAEMARKLRKQTIEIANSMVIKVLEDFLTTKYQKYIIDKRLKEITKINSET